MTSLHVSSTPHIHQRGSSTQRIMLDVLIALVPAAAAGVVAQQADQRQVGRRHGIVRKLVRPHPLQRRVLTTLNHPRPASAQVKWHEKVKAFVSVAGKHKWRQAGLGDVDVQLFLEFAHQRRLGSLTRVDLSARKLP